MPAETGERELSLYIGYAQLRASDLADLLLLFNSIFDFTCDSYFELTGVRFDRRPSLEVSEIHTGDSIKVAFTEGWRPRVYSDKDHDIVIAAPKKIGVPLLIAFLLLQGAAKALEIRNQYLDGELKRIELQLKQEEIHRMLDRERGETLRELERKSDVVLLSLVANPNFTEVRVNDVKLKSPRKTT